MLIRRTERSIPTNIISRMVNGKRLDAPALGDTQLQVQTNGFRRRNCRMFGVGIRRIYEFN